MPRLLRFCTLIAVIAAVAIIGAAALGGMLPGAAEVALYGFAWCEGEPCVLGIVPGALWQEAERTLIAAGAERVAADVLLVKPPSGKELSFQRGFNSNRIAVVETTVVRRMNFPRLGSFVALYGPPCRVSGYANLYGDVIWLNVEYPRMTIRIEPRFDHVGVHSRIVQVRLFGQPHDQCLLARPSPRSAIREYEWTGFRTLNYYMALNQ